MGALGLSTSRRFSYRTSLFPARKPNLMHRPVVADCVPVKDGGGEVGRLSRVEIEKAWLSAEAVCFDVDSTVCTDEGIDELANFLEKGEEVAAWTAKAMDGSIPFEEALAARLAIIQPSKAQVDAYLSQNPPSLSPGIHQLVNALLDRGKEVFLVSGGFRQMIEPVAEILGVPRSNIYANRLLFDPNTGDYAGFDESEYTSRAGGKATAIRALKAEGGYGKIVMVGDGATDAEARQEGGADAFIGYGGTQERPAVKALADWYVYDFEGLISMLDDSESRT